MVSLFVVVVVTVVNISGDSMVGDFDHEAALAIRAVSGLVAIISVLVFDTIASRMLRESSDKRMLREILNEHHVVFPDPSDETIEQKRKPKRPVALYVTSALMFGTTFLTILL